MPTHSDSDALPEWLEADEDTSSLPVAEDDAPVLPACPRCLSPFAVEDRYCSSCGFCVGQFTPYMPVEGIRFGTDLYRAAWRTADGHNSQHTGLRGLAVLYLLIASPLVTALGVLLRIFRAPKAGPSASALSRPEDPPGA